MPDRGLFNPFDSPNDGRIEEHHREAPDRAGRVLCEVYGRSDGESSLQTNSGR